ncbi:MAG TPA: MoaD/ThiS family protein [Terriglobales bacterium]|nr:MoaD/ThiS family protein [Terriglobales bacterium]
MIVVELPPHLRTLAHVGGEVALEAPEPATLGGVLDALEARYPMLRGTIRDHDTLQRRAYVRYFAGARDVSHDPPDALLPTEVAQGTEPFIILGAIAGG